MIAFLRRPLSSLRAALAQSAAGARSDQRGAILLPIALAAMPVLLGGAFAVDYARAVWIAEDLQRAADAAALAGALEDDPNARVATARRYLQANLPPALSAVVKNAEIVADGADVAISLDHWEPTQLGGFIGFEALPVGADASARRFSSEAEVAVVIDHSYITRLTIEDEDAANLLVETLEAKFTNMMAISPNSRIAIIPYNKHVNVGIDRQEWVSRIDDDDSDVFAGCVTTRLGKERHELADNAMRLNDEPPTTYDLRFPHVFNSEQTACPPTMQHLSGDMEKVSDNFYRIAHEARFLASCIEGELPDLGEIETQPSPEACRNVVEGANTDDGLAWAVRALSPKWRGVWSEEENDWPRDVGGGDKIVYLVTDGKAASPNLHSIGHGSLLGQILIEIAEAAERDARVKGLRVVCDELDRLEAIVHIVYIEGEQLVVQDYRDCGEGEFVEADSAEHATRAIRAIGDGATVRLIE